MFQTNGSTHHNGVANEHDTIALLNAHNVYPEQVTHLGGTRNKADAMAGSKGISIKHKAGVRNGSFDWVNTTHTDGVIDRTVFSDFLGFVAAARNWSTEQRLAIVEETRDLLNEVCSSALDSITPQDLTAFLTEHVAKANQGMGIIINDTNAQTLHILEADRLDLTRCLADGWTAHLISGKGMTSRKIVLKRLGQTLDLGLRLRLTSNNGIKAFLGLSKANRNSSIVLKVQQDSVGDFLTQDPDRQILTYAA